MSKNRTPIWVIGLSLIVMAVPGMWIYMTVTAPVLHPKPLEVPSAMNSAPLPKSAGAAEQARQIVNAHLTARNLPGLSVAVGIGDDVVWAEGFGFADLQTRAVITPNDRFRIGTASTVLSSAAAGLLLEDGRLRLDDTIQKYVPEFPQKQWPVTLRELMGHTAGIIPDGGDEGPLFSKHCERPVDALRYFAEDPLLFEPGTKYRYSGYSWILVSAAVEAAANQPFLAFMKERVFDPLKMGNTIPDSGTTEPDDDHPLFNLFRERVIDPRTKRPTTSGSPKKADQVTSYFPRFSADPTYGLHLMRPLDFSCYAGSSAFVSTPSDLVRFGMAINTGKLLKSATVKLLQTSQRLASGEDTGYGLGWNIETATLGGKQTKMLGHNGELLGGMAASLMTFPQQGMAVAVISNISYADTASLAMKIAEAFAEQGNYSSGK